MTEFFKKYRGKIIYLTVLTILVFYFTPRQRQYYLDQDILKFKDQYLIPALIWTFGLLAVGLLIFWLIKYKDYKKSIFGFISTVTVYAFTIFFFQDIFLGFSLFINRQSSKETIEKKYKASLIDEDEKSKNFVTFFDLASGKIVNDNKIINKFYSTELKNNDTFKLELKIGILGIPFSDKKLNDQY